MQYNNGVYTITNSEYHASSAISRSNLMDFQQSPYHYWYNKLSNLKQEKEATPAMIMGELVHTLTLEPQESQKRFCIAPECDRRTKAGKATYESYLELKGDKISVKYDVMDIAIKMAAQVRLNEIASFLIQDSKIENSIYFTHSITGLQCKVRPDAWKDGIVSDLKTTDNASFRAFQSSALKYGYFLQAGMIKQGLESIGLSLEQFVFIAVEKEEPYAVALYPLDEESINYGSNLFDKLMIGLHDCQQKNEWPTYENKYLTVPAWAKNENLQGEN